MKWREAEGSGLGYLVQVTPMAGMASAPFPLGLLEMGLGSQENDPSPKCLAKHAVLLLRNAMWPSLIK